MTTREKNNSSDWNSFELCGDTETSIGGIMHRNLIYIIVLTAALAVWGFCLSGCAPGHADRESRQTPTLIWPDPPEIARIQYITEIHDPVDLQITTGFWERFWNYLTGRSAPELVAPFGVALDDSGRLYVADTFLKRIQLFDPQQGKTHLFPPEDEPMSSPIDIAVNNEGDRIFVSDSQEGLIRIFRRNGNSCPEPAAEIGNHLLKRPTGITFSRVTGELLVVDTELAAIFRFDPQSLRPLGRFGTFGIAPGEFNRPTGVCTDLDGHIIVTDALNFRVQVFTATGTFLHSFGSAGDGPGHFARPRGVATDSDNNIYVVDALFDNIQIFDHDGRLLLAFGSPGHAPGQFWLPAGIYIDSRDRIHVADFYNKRVQIFQYHNKGRKKP